VILHCIIDDDDDDDDELLNVLDYGSKLNEWIPYFFYTTKRELMSFSHLFNKMRNLLKGPIIGILKNLENILMNLERYVTSCLYLVLSKCYTKRTWHGEILKMPTMSQTKFYDQEKIV